MFATVRNARDARNRPFLVPKGVMSIGRACSINSEIRDWLDLLNTGFQLANTLQILNIDQWRFFCMIIVLETELQKGSYDVCLPLLTWNRY